MPVFAYKALDPKGAESSGTVSADNRAAAIEQVVLRGFTPILVAQDAALAPAAQARRNAPQRVSQAHVDAFTRELANLLSAGVPLSRGLNIVVREASSPAARAQWTAIHDDVVGGSSLADAMAQWPRSFPPVYVAMVRAGETGGFLDLVLNQISEFHAREDDLKGKVKAALVYPAVLATIATGVVIFLLTYFIPRFSAIFKEFGGSLPWLTRAIVTASEMVMKHGLIVAIAAFLLFLLIRRGLQTDSGRRTIEKILLSSPLLGGVMARFALIRFFRMLGTLIGAGVGLIASLRVAKEAIGNQTLADTVALAVEDVQSGASLSKSLGRSAQLFPPSVVEMVAVAEETGRLDRELQRISTSFETDLDRRLRMLVALAEPLLLFCMAAVIGVIVVGMLLPLFQLQDLIH
ncbi:MAG TPA: type II secretion system F family protein [Planctomycetota bacterium]|jgi:type II secretory pathway component PulF